MTFYFLIAYNTFLFIAEWSDQMSKSYVFPTEANNLLFIITFAIIITISPHLKIV